MTTTKKEKNRYIETVGRRKTAVARVRIFDEGKGSFTINDKDIKFYFPTNELQSIVRAPFSKSEISSKWNVSALIKGGGVHAQAEALRHGITRALVLHDESLRIKLKKFGFLKRDPRKVERKKPGLKKARKSPTWSKR